MRIRNCRAGISQCVSFAIVEPHIVFPSMAVQMCLKYDVIVWAISFTHFSFRL